MKTKLQKILSSLKDKNISSREIEMGVTVEKEHTKIPWKAAIIAGTHLKEDPKYYTKLKKAGLADELKETIIKEFLDDLRG